MNVRDLENNEVKNIADKVVNMGDGWVIDEKMSKPSYGIYYIRRVHQATNRVAHVIRLYPNHFSIFTQNRVREGAGWGNDGHHNQYQHPFFRRACELIWKEVDHCVEVHP